MAVRIHKTVRIVRVAARGPQGAPGAAGVGVPAGGTTGQVLAKASNADHDTEWVTGGGGGGVTDHGALTGLADDDHTQYALADGTRWTTTMTAGRAVVSDGTGALVASAVTAVELGYLAGVTSAIQTQLDGKAAAAHTHTAGDVTDFSAAADARIAAAGLDALADVTITGVAAGELLAWSGAAWINRTLAEAGVAAASHTHTLADITDAGTAAGADTGDFAAAVHAHAAGDVTSGTFADARIAASNVTQHQGSIDHGSVAGLGDDDHAQYSLADGTRWTAVQTASRAVVSSAAGVLVVSAVTSAELGHLSGVTSAIQTQLDGKAASSHTHAAADIVSGVLDTARLGTGTANSLKYLAGDSTWKTLSVAPTPTFTVGAAFDGGGSAPTVNAGVQVGVSKGGTITEAFLVATDDAGDRAADTLTVSVSKVDSGGTETALGTIALAAASYNRDTTLTGWTKTLAAGDSIKFEITTAGAVATRVTVKLKAT